MIWMILAILAMGAFANIMRYAQTLAANMVWVGAVCYLTAAVACGGWALNQQVTPGWPEGIFGVGSGVTILAGYFLFSACIRMAGVGVAQVFERLSMVVAAVISILLWRNVPGIMLGVGLLLAVVSIPLISPGSTVVQISGSRRRVPMLVLLLLVTGLGSAMLEGYRRNTSGGFMVTFLLCQYVTIGLGALAAAMWRAGRPHRRDVLCGIALGLVNILFYYSSLCSLSPARPGTVVFPTLASGTILVSTGAAALLWGERYRPRTLLGMGLAVVALILMNMKPPAM